jgi:hypothetical protein
MAVRVLFRLASGEHRVGTAPSFEAARAAFEEAWHMCTWLSAAKADFQAWRDDQ